MILKSEGSRMINKSPRNTNSWTAVKDKALITSHKPMEKNAKIYIAGHRGMVGSAIVRKLKEQGYNNLILRSHEELDLTNQLATRKFFEEVRPEYVILTAAKVGGIAANMKSPADFLYENLMIECNVIEFSRKYGVKKLLFMGSSCIYPRLCPQPMKEDYLLTGPFEPTNEGYALAKVAGIKLCYYNNMQYGTKFISLIPPNIYGPGDNFNPVSSHVIAALIRKFHIAKTENHRFVEIWGSGNARREFMFVEDLADGAIFLMNNYESSEWINIGVGEDITIKHLAMLIKDVVGFKGEIRFNPSKPDGMPQKLLDISRISALGWKAKTNLIDGIKLTYKWFLKNIWRDLK